MTHNSHAVPGDTWSPSQFKREPSQFNDGIRGFAMDIYEENGRLVLKHNKHDPLEVDYVQRVREIVAELEKTQNRNEFLLVQFETYVSDQGIERACAAWGDKVIKNFDTSRRLEFYISRGMQVLLLTDHGKAMPHLGMHKSTKFLAENNYKWTDPLKSPDLAWRRGPQGGTLRYAKMMTYFCSRTGMGNPLTSAEVNDPGRMLYHARQFMKQSYAQGKLNVIMVDFYTEGDPLQAQKAIRAGNMYSGCLGDGTSCLSG
eukprot:CAMPEP_0197454894 /NCGR_PEP_ID=MMETSP1175-20131217/39300_1 /TAXON_ID=1003142 /ORGANISM="Triceratium dubium, Strain CCMP147" /LENGTH=257 /DNA_ID=CAMNT_0042988607 /DNA_START=292 /DNA_END=1061 /DNA_ORIENTATION=+